MQNLNLFGEPIHEKGNEKHAILHEKFVAPPFSVLDTRRGYWQHRKAWWLKKIGYELQGLKSNLLGKNKNTILSKINMGTSIFDPVLAEILLKWFCPAGGKVLDPFAGEAIKGIVAELLGYDYYATEIRIEQVAANIDLAIKNGVAPFYVCEDANNIKQALQKYAPFDFCFTSPPYYDLEVYSKEDMSALPTYDVFLQQYENIFKQCYELLNQNRFLAIKVGEIRNKKTGEYYGFVADNIKIMQRIGFKFYNDMVLINAIGTAPLRANTHFKTRKVVHLHQNVLVFYKGDLKKIKEIFEGVPNAD